MTATIIAIIIAAVAMTAVVVLFLQWQKVKKDNKKIEEESEKQQIETNQRMYELAILKELGERVGYSLNVEKIIDIITGSLRQFMDYSAVSYMLLEPEKIIFKVDLEKSVSRNFIDEVQNRMLKSLSALLDKEFKKDQIEETLSGAILVDDLETPVKSFFNIPLVIGDKVVGVLTVAHTKEGLYKEEEMTILYKITQQASNAVTQLQDVVQTEQGKLNSMVSSMTEGVVMTDKDYRVMVVNPAAKMAVGLSEEKEEVTIFDFIDNLEGRFDIRGKLEESVKLKKLLITDEVLIGDKFYQIIVSPVRSSYGIAKDQILGGVVLFHDITKEKELEKMREDFTSMMVHELRSPLDGIKSMSEMMAKEGFLEKIETYNNFVGMINSSSNDMLDLVNDLLDLAKIEAGKFSINKQNSDVKELITDRVNFFTPAAQDRGVALKSQFGKDIPNEISFDPKRIKRVLNNLISNSIKFNSEGGEVIVQAFIHKKGNDITKELEVNNIKWVNINLDKQISSSPDSLVISVTDNGIGISNEDMPKLFNKFVQFQEASTREEKGTGLGLVISKGIVDAHNGIIGVESEQGVGSTFYFLLPIS
ncbi:MAG: ATP-binding protein [Patescibacteria group bacterium]